jgi:hypothetical protein
MFLKVCANDFLHKYARKIYLGNKFYDPRISRIEKILGKFCPKFLDLYASIYGNYNRHLNGRQCLTIFCSN